MPAKSLKTLNFRLAALNCVGRAKATATPTYAPLIVVPKATTPIQPKHAKIAYGQVEYLEGLAQLRRENSDLRNRAIELALAI